MANTEQDQKIQKAYSFLSDMSSRAYSDTFLISNQVLSKNPFTNNFLKRYLANDFTVALNRTVLFKKILKYFFFSVKNFLKYCFEFLEYFISGMRYQHKKNEELVIIDMPFLISNIQKDRKFNDSYFPGLASFLSKSNRLYAYLPIFVGMKRRCVMSKILRILKQQKIPVMVEYQLLNVWDLFFLLNFIVIYPFRVFAFIKKLNSDDPKQHLLRSELLHSLSDITFMSYSRYLLGKRIAQLPCKKIKVISWDENQADNKNFYKGLRSHPKKVEIIGAQLLIYSKNVLNITTDEREICFGVVPDTLLVNGPWYIPQNTLLHYSVGPSLRFREIFNFQALPSNESNILVLLPYYKNEIRNILDVIRNIEFPNLNLLIKPHPVTDITQFHSLLPKHAIIVYDNIYSLFRKARIVIGGGASGTLLEAATVGIPTIFVQNAAALNGNSLPDLGKGVIWDSALTKEELKKKVKNLNEMIMRNQHEIETLAKSYKDAFFCEPTDENIARAFNLNCN